MADSKFTPAQVRELRASMGLDPDGPDPDPAAVVAVIVALRIIADEYARWLDLQ